VDEPVDLEALAAEVAGTVAERRAAGLYPPGLEAQLDAHFVRVANRALETPLDVVDRAVEAVVARGPLTVPDVAPTSSYPGGAAVHRVVGRTVVRHEQALVEELNRTLSAVTEALVAIQGAIERLPWAQSPELVSTLESIDERIAGIERRVNGAS